MAQHLTLLLQLCFIILLAEIPSVARNSIRKELEKLIMAVVSQLHAPTVLPPEKEPRVLTE
jgi:hypothetical protein